MKICFMLISKKDKKTPLISCIKDENEKYFLPTFDFTENDYPDLFSFTRNKFKEITKLNAIDLNGVGWVYLHMCGSLVKDNELHIVYGCIIPETFGLKNNEWISIIDILEKNLIEEQYLKQLVYCFNAISR